MNCYVYRSRRKPDTYLYLRAKDDFSVLPPGLTSVFGKPEFAFEFELAEGRKLAAADSREVVTQLTEWGFYLQLPPAED